MSSTTERSRSRRERTFVGSECAVCEEPLEHTLRGERIFQFSCFHVSHEACFYEFIRDLEAQYCPTCDAPLHLDTSRGGNVIDMRKTSLLTECAVEGSADLRTEKMSSIVRSAGGNDPRSMQTSAPAWDNQTVRAPSVDSGGPRQHHAPTGGRESVARREAERYVQPRHERSNSEATGVASSGGYPETTQSGPSRRHDYDVQAMETTPASPRPMSRNPIPAPIVTVRSEFPTVSRSRQQQTLTCLVTIEAPDNKWRPDPEDLGAPVPQPPPSINTRMLEDTASSVRPGSPTHSAPRFYPYESAEALEEMTDSLRKRVDNWHGLDFSRYGLLLSCYACVLDD